MEIDPFFLKDLKKDPKANIFFCKWTRPNSDQIVWLKYSQNESIRLEKCVLPSGSVAILEAAMIAENPFLPLPTRCAKKDCHRAPTKHCAPLQDCSWQTCGKSYCDTHLRLIYSHAYQCPACVRAENTRLAAKKEAAQKCCCVVT